LDGEALKAAYGIGEIAEMFGETVPTIRYWADEFEEFVHPRRNGKGDRIFSPDDLQSLKIIRHLIRERRFTLAGARNRLRDNRDAELKNAEIACRLNKIKSMLTEIKDMIE
jgi:DNA-binding transcriptional MerR regulator